MMFTNVQVFIIMIIRRISFTFAKGIFFRSIRQFNTEKNVQIVAPKIPELAAQKQAITSEAVEIDDELQLQHQELLESQQTVFSENIVIGGVNLQQMLQNFIQFPSSVSLKQQVSAIRLIYNELCSKKRIKLKQKSLLGGCTFKIKHEQVDLLDESQFQQLVDYVVFVKRGKMISQMSDLQTRLYTEFIRRISQESFGDMPIYRVSELYLKLSFLYSVKKKYLTEVPKLLLERVFSGNGVGVELQAVLNILQGIYNFDHFFFQERCLISNLLRLLHKNYKGFNNLDRLKLVSFLLQFDIERHFSLYLSIQVQVMEMFIGDLKLNMFNYDEEQLYVIINSKYQYNNLGQRREIQSHLMSQILSNFNGDGSRCSYTMSMKVIFNFLIHYTERHKFNELSVEEKEKFVSIMSIKTSEYFRSRLQVYMKMIEFNYFEEQRSFVKEMKSEIDFKRMAPPFLYEVSRLGVVIEPMTMSIIQANYKRTMLWQYRTRGLVDEMRMILTCKIQQRLQPNELYFQGLANQKFFEFEALIFSNFDRYMPALIQVKSSLLIEFSVQMNLVGSFLALEGEIKGMSTTKKEIMYFFILKSTKDAETVIFGKPIYKYLSGPSLYRLLQKEDKSESKIVSSPILKSIYFYLLRAIKTYKVKGTLDYNFLVLKFIYNILNRTTLIMGESLANHVQQRYFELYWKILSLLTDYIDVLEKIPNCSHKFKSVLQYIFQFQPNPFSACVQYGQFVAKCLKLLPKFNLHTIPVDKIMRSAFQLKIINQINFSDFNIRGGNERPQQFSIMLFLNYFQDSEKSQIINNMVVFKTIKSKQTLTMEHISKIVQYFKDCKLQKIFTVVLSLFNLPLQYNHGRTFFYIWRRFVNNCQQKCILSFNICNILINIDRYLQFLQFSSVQFDEIKSQISVWMKEVMSLHLAVYRELPLNYFVIIANFALKYDGLKINEIQNVFLNSLFQPYKALNGKISIVDLLTRNDYKFSVEQVKGIMQTVVMPLNMQKIEQRHYLNPRQQTSRYSIYLLKLNGRNAYVLQKQIWKINRHSFNIYNPFSQEGSDLAKNTFVFVIGGQIVVLSSKSDFLSREKNQRKQGFAEIFNISVQYIQEIRFQNTQSQTIRKTFQLRLDIDGRLEQKDNKLINFFVQMFSQIKNSYQIQKQFEELKAEGMVEIQMQQLLKQNDKLRLESDLL